MTVGPEITFGEPVFGRGPTLGGWRETVSWNGTSFLVAWWDLRGISAARVSEQGALLDNRPIRIFPEWVPTGSFDYASAFASASDGSSHFIAWTPGWGEGGPRGARVGPTGELLDAAPLALPKDTLDALAS